MILFFETEPYREDFRRDAKRFMAPLCENPDHLYVIWGEKFPYDELILPLEALPKYESFKAVPLAWTYVTPFTTRRLQQFGITHLYQALYQRDDVFLIGCKSQEGILKRYLDVHYGVHIVGVTVPAHAARKDVYCWAAVVADESLEERMPK